MFIVTEYAALRFVLLFISVHSVISYLDVPDSCRCKQCDHIMTVQLHCQCCIYHLHGKRSLQDGSRSKRLSTIDLIIERQPLSNILELLEILDALQRNSYKSDLDDTNNRKSGLYSLDLFNDFDTYKR